MLSAAFLATILAVLVIIVPAILFFCGPGFPSSWYEIRPGMTFGEVDRRLSAQGMEYGMSREVDGTWYLFYSYDYDIDDAGNDPWWYGNEIHVQVKVPDPRPSSETHYMPTETAVGSVVLLRFPRHHWMRGWPFHVGETQHPINYAP